MRYKQATILGKGLGCGKSPHTHFLIIFWHNNTIQALAIYPSNPNFVKMKMFVHQSRIHVDLQGLAPKIFPRSLSPKLPRFWNSMDYETDWACFDSSTLSTVKGRCSFWVHGGRCYPRHGLPSGLTPKLSSFSQFSKFPVAWGARDPKFCPNTLPTSGDVLYLSQGLA